MDRLNPYQAPPLIENESGGNAIKVVLRIGAVSCWLLSAGWLVIMVLLLLDDPAPIVFQSRPYVFVVMFLTMFLSPASGLILVGLSAWRQSWRPALYGVALFVPLGLLVIIRTFYW